MTSALRCATCGTEETRSESRFCRACGAPLAQPAPKASPAAQSVEVRRAPQGATIPATRAAVPKTIPEREPVRRVAPTRFDPESSSSPHGQSTSNPIAYRLSPAPPIAYPSSPQLVVPPRAPGGLSFGGLVVRTIVATALSVGALLASDQAYESVKKPAGAWVSETFSQDRATSRAIVGGGIAVTATLLVTMTVLLVSTRRRS